jgi:hypothetical protein
MDNSTLETNRSLKELVSEDVHFNKHSQHSNPSNRMPQPRHRNYQQEFVGGKMIGN